MVRTDVSSSLKKICNIVRNRKSYFSNNIHPLDDFSEHDVLSIKPAGLGTGDEELAAVSIGAGICHR